MTTTTNTKALLAILLPIGLMGGLVTGCSSSSGGGGASDTPEVDSGAPSATTEDSGAPAAQDDAATTPTGCVYPKGPYGVTVGKTLDPSLTWQGFVPGSSTPTTVKVTDLYDCDGSKGLNAIVVDSSGQWCVACQGIAEYIPQWFSPKGEDWTKLGVTMLNLVIQNNNYLPATVTTAEQWRSLFKLTNIYVVADPNDTFPTESLPYELLVNPRTMKVTHDLSNDTDLNNDGSDPEVTALAKKNATVK